MYATVNNILDFMLFRVYVREQHRYNTRKAIHGHMAHLRPKTDAVCRSVLFRAITIRNNLSPAVTEASTRANLKKLLIKSMLSKS